MRSLLPARVPSDTTIGTVSFTELSHIDKIYKSTGVGAARRTESPELLRCAVSGVSWRAFSKCVITAMRDACGSVRESAYRSDELNVSVRDRLQGGVGASFCGKLLQA